MHAKNVLAVWWGLVILGEVMASCLKEYHPCHVAGAKRCFEHRIINYSN